ncbi:MAG: hypothetical protein AAFQ79_08030 [Pseudomonadota bacterium]
MTWTEANLDPKGVIRESYRIEGISEPECRSIFLDWAIGVPDGADPRAGITALLDKYAADAPDHPMTRVLQEGLDTPPQPRRRGGRGGRQGA